ncbi:MAG: DUF5108 domain-containing protein [Porphyromonadaceae bacterium]|nr:DUF5108 domain-containing protein [Porphyromonadaceae bacterium]
MKKTLSKYLSILAVLLLAASLYSCDDPFANDSYLDEALELPAATFMNNDPDNYSLWVELLKYTNLYNSINLNANYTCFVPNNEAFNQYLSSKNYTSVSEIDKEFATILVKYHTIKGASYISSNFENGVLPDTTATGDFLTIENKGLNAITINNEATIVGLDKLVTNGVIQTIDKVLTPITETITDKLSNPSFSIFMSAVEAVGYSEMLDRIITSETQQDGTVIQKKYKYTLFAVPNSVYTTNGINDLASLAAYLGADADYTNPENLLYKYISYHILPQLASFSTLATFSGNVKSKNLATLAKNELVNFSEVDNKLYINYNQTANTFVQLAEINLACKNGVMHVVDDIMPIEAPPATQVKWEFTDYPYIAARFSNVYRITTMTSSFTGWLPSEVNGQECYTWLAVPEDRDGVGYHIGDRNAQEMKKGLYTDFMILKLGMFGWIEMEIPAIIKGKYSVVLGHYNRLASAPGAKLSFIFDGEYVGNPISTSGASNKADQYRETTIGNIEFTETKTHMLRILAGDDDQSYLDCLIFKPIN